MSETVIRVEGLWKEYRLGTINHGTLKADLASWWARQRGQEDPNRSITAFSSSTEGQAGQRDRFWALRDVDFEVKQGEVLGIIGKNGAGKSTLLKLLSRVTTPTRGQIKVRGRIASLLEVGTGFHPDLTGRENVFLNGAILGMSKGEIRSKLDEIISFAEVDRFIDTPVKRYSSGMYVRLAFAVAAHLDPEILVVDEVLAVGDASFQKKCIGKMSQVASAGRTVLFVSHNIGSIKALCNRCCVLRGGALQFIGNVDTAVNHYYGAESNRLEGRVIVNNSMRVKGNGSVRVQQVATLDSNGMERSTFLINETIDIQISIISEIEEKIYFWLFITNDNGDAVISSHQGDKSVFQINKLEYVVTARLEELGLLPGSYKLSIGAFGPQLTFLEWVDSCISLTIDNAFETGKTFDQRLGLVDRAAGWSIVEKMRD